MSWLDQYFTGYSNVQQNGTPLPQRTILNFLGQTATDNPANLSTDIAQGALVNPTVDGLTTWNPFALSPATAGVVYSALFTAQTTSGAHTAVQVGKNIPLPNQTAVAGMPTPPVGGVLRVDYELDIAGTTTAVGAFYKGNWAWAVHSATVNSMGASATQSVAIGTNSGSVPASWTATLQVSTGQAQIITTTDASDTYTCKITLQWGYVL